MVFVTLQPLPFFYLSTRLCRCAAVLQDLIAEAICAGWADVRYAIAPPLKEKGDGGYEESLSKAERGKVQGEVLATIRKNLAEE